MVNPFICGSGTFHHQSEEEDEDVPSSPNSTPRKPRKLWRTKENKNPYARMGRDKFSALLAELEDKRREIYTQLGSEEISFVRFSISNSNRYKPIVVRARDRGRDKKKSIEHSSKGIILDKCSTESSASPNEANQARNESGDERSKKKRKMKMGMWRPFYYLLTVVVSILFFMSVFGRPFTILCVSIGWYLVPAIKRGSSNGRRGREKKIVTDGLSSPKRGDINGAVDGSLAPRKSW